MKRSAAVAVIGGGVIGASVAYHLAKNGMRDIVILDRAARPGEGSTGKATGGFRAQFATAINVRLSLRSREKLLGFRDDTGVDSGYQQVGYLWLAESETQLDALRKARLVQHAEGLLEAVELSHDEIGSVNASISTEGVLGAAFCPTDGYIKPLEILRGYLEAGVRAGVKTTWSTECVGFDRYPNGRIAAVRTSMGKIAVDAVVNAGGPWAARIAEMANLDLPVIALRRQAAFTEPTDAIPADMPMTIFMDDGFHVRAREGRALLCWPNPEQPGDPVELSADDAWIAKVASMGWDRVPALRGVRIDRAQCYAGLYEMSPDHHAIIGASPECDNLFLANGSSGHGVMHSPALGEILADIIVGRGPVVDVSALRPSRFDEGAPLAAAELL